MGNFQAPELTPEQQRSDELRAAGLVRDSFSGRVIPIDTGPAPTAAEVDAGWAKIREEARVNTAAREAQEAAQRLELAQATATVAAEKEAAWTRYVNLAGRTADGGLVASRQIFESTWLRHLAQRAIAESLAPATG